MEMDSLQKSKKKIKWQRTKSDMKEDGSFKLRTETKLE